MNLDVPSRKHSRPSRFETANTAIGAHDAEREETDQEQSLRWGVNAGFERHFAEGTFRHVKANEVRDPVRAKVAERIGAYFGKEVVFFETDNPEARFFEGMFSVGAPNRVFVRADAQSPHMFLVGHEISHALENDNKEVYDKLLAVARQEMSGLEAFRSELDAVARSYGEPAATEEGAAKELLGDFIGDVMHEKKFWQALHDLAPKSFRKIAHVVRQLLDRILVRNPYEPESYKYFRDIAKVRKAVTEALKETYGPVAEKVQRADVRKFQEVARAYYNRSAPPKYSLKAPAPHDSDTIAWEPRKKSAKEWFAKLKSDAYQQFVDEAAPAIHAAERISPELGQAMREEFSRKRGSAGPFELLIGKDKRSKGLVTWWQEDATGKVEGSKNLAKVFAPIKDEEHYRDWTRMVFAERDLALAAFRPEVKLEEYRAQRTHLRSLLAVAETKEEKRIVRSALKDAKLMYERGVSGVDADAARAELAVLPDHVPTLL